MNCLSITTAVFRYWTAMNTHTRMGFHWWQTPQPALHASHKPAFQKARNDVHGYVPTSARNLHIMKRANRQALKLQPQSMKMQLPNSTAVVSKAIAVRMRIWFHGCKVPYEKLGHKTYVDNCRRRSGLQSNFDPYRTNRLPIRHLKRAWSSNAGHATWGRFRRDAGRPQS